MSVSALEESLTTDLDVKMENMTIAEVDKLTKEIGAAILLAAFGIIREENIGGRVLLLKRAENDEIFPGQWDLPGGGFKEGKDQDSSATIVREAREETGLDVEIKSRLGIVHQPIMIKGQLWILRIYVYDLTVPDFDQSQIRLDPEHEAWIFADPANAAETLPLAGKTGLALQMALAQNPKVL